MKVLIMIFSLLCVACSSGSKNAIMVDIYYIPIGVETYVPITTGNIESSATYVGRVEESNRNFKKFLELIESSSGRHFDEKKIRGKLVWPDKEVVYIDNNGSVKSSDDGKRLIKKSNLDKAKKMLEKLTVKK